MKIINENVPNLSRIEADAVMPYDLAVAKSDCEKKEKEIEDRLKKADKLQQEESPNVREPKPANKNPQLKKLNLEESLFEDIDIDKVDDIADRYVTSKPVSGDWATETKHELKAIMDELGLSKEEAMKVMIDRLGFDEEEFAEGCSKEVKEEICPVCGEDVDEPCEECKYKMEKVEEEICPICGDDVDEPCEECKAKMGLEEAKREPVTLFDRVMIELDKQMAEYSRGKAKRLLDKPNAERYDSEEGEIFSAIDDDGITVAADDLTFAQEVADAYDLDTKDTILGDKPALTILLPEEDEMELPRRS